MFTASTLAPLASWEKEDHLLICLGVDVGGSGLRIRISNAINKDQFIDLAHIRAQSTEHTHEVFINLTNAINDVVPDFETKGAVLAVAGPISNGSVVLTNWPGEVSVRTLTISKLPQRICPQGRTLFLNDLEAGAYGIIAGDEQHILEQYFEQLWPQVAPQGPIVSDSRTAVLAMGSGLGVALIVKSPLLDKPLVVPTELGHLQIPAVCNEDPNHEEEHKIIQHVSNHYYGGAQMPEYEDIASGRGICLAYQYCKMRDTKEKIPIERINGGDIAEAARLGEKTARDALSWHYKIFMRIAKAVSTSLNCDSVILALDNQVKNAWFVSAISDQLQDEFYNFIRPDWMKGIRVYSQKEVLNFNILGNDYMAHQISTK